MGKYFRTFRSKVIALTVLVVLSTQAATVAAVLIAENREFNMRATENLLKCSRMFEKFIENRAYLLRRALLPLSVESEFLAAVQSEDTGLITAELGKHADWIDADIALFTDHEGNIVAAAGAPVSPIIDLSNLTKAEHTTISLNDDYYEMVSAPLEIVNAPDQVSAGYVSMGFALDDSLAQRFAAVADMELTLIVAKAQNKNTPSNIAILGSSLSGGPRELIRKISQQIAEGMDPKLAAEVMRSDYLSTRVSYLPDRGDVFAILQMPITEAIAPFNVLRGTLIHAAATAILAALIVAFYVSRRLERPVHRLLHAARRMQIGNYDRKLELDTHDEFGELASAFESMREGIAEREQRIVYQAQFDNLTGLPNRSQGMELLRASLRISGKTGNPVAVIVMHLQRFREIESSLGHEIGEEVLRQTAQRIRKILDESQVLAKLEGDQFLIIAPNTDSETGIVLAEKLSNLLDAGLTVQSVNITLDTCIGMVISPEHGRQPDELLRRAAVAKNDAQRARQRIHVYQNGREAKHVRQLAILGDLRRAVQEDELKLYLQPKITLSDSRTCGAEALLRWDHPELGPIPPDEFIPLAEDAGSISMVTEWVVNHVAAQCAELQKLGIDLPVALNLSRRDLMNRKLPGMINAQLEKHGVAPSRIILEITEEAIVQDVDRAAAILDSLRAMGMSISMDDFGTGYSSLGHLRKLPVDELKIDRAFVTNLPDEHQNVAIVRSIIELAHNLNLEVVAEGVETAAALRWLREEGCERAQGYYLSKPMPAAAFPDWLKNWENLTNEESERGEKADPGDSMILRPYPVT